MASATDLTAQSPPAGPRIPKLKYRNPLPPEQILLLPQTSAQETAHPPLQRQTSATSSDVPPSPYRPSFETTASTTSSSLASTPSSHSSSNDSKTSKKKKKSNSVFSFLSLKEPSQLALEQFAEQQRKQGNGRSSVSPSNVSTRTGGTSGTFATKKLPDSVPKVNSKWDGIPDAVRKRQSTTSTVATTSKDTKRSSGSSLGQGSHLSAMPWNTSELSVMSNESRGPPNSILSVAAVNADIYHNGHYVPISPSESSLAEPSYYCPEEPMASGALPIERPAAVQASAGSPHNASFDTVRDDRPDSPASSIGSVDTIVRAEAEVIFRKMNDRPQQQTFWGGSAPAVQTPSEPESSVPESHDFLFELPSSTSLQSQKNDSPMASPAASYTAPAVRYTEPPAHYVPSTAHDNAPLVPYYSPSRSVHNFSRPMVSTTPTKHVNLFQPAPPSPTGPSSLRSRTMSSGLPTLYENSITSTESLETIRDDSDARSIAPSFTPSSIAPSELSEHWHQSSRDRLGLGGQMRKSDVLPWGKTMEDSPGKPKNRHRLSLLMKSALRS
ncbi:uncharacterized protein M421DRAFT_416949 [Didymella exigua CBS 183.55]|uniref:Uncharacterized protein n=1 Tax=Didymella exigua CBS 183.55 TaxID=1150837 RepID=A0A6A5RYD1_9PLEO|nr:uncharacterized protein M421DRAFT_416949 [Didymella exigua CBS 183.55]KAF1932224.1 hypothetical protein M421DRAFT_416949 [Didymella exigua CBS 183.55]